MALVRGLRLAAGLSLLNKNVFRLPDATPLLCSQTYGQNGEIDGGKKNPAAHPLGRKWPPDGLWERPREVFLKSAAFVSAKWRTMNEGGLARAVRRPTPRSGANRVSRFAGRFSGMPIRRAAATPSQEKAPAAAVDKGEAGGGEPVNAPPPSGGRGGPPSRGRPCLLLLSASEPEASEESPPAEEEEQAEAAAAPADGDEEQQAADEEPTENGDKAEEGAPDEEGDEGKSKKE